MGISIIGTIVESQKTKKPTTYANYQQQANQHSTLSILR